MLQEKKAAACSANKQFWVERKPVFERGQKNIPQPVNIHLHSNLKTEQQYVFFIH